MRMQVAAAPAGGELENRSSRPSPASRSADGSINLCDVVLDVELRGRRHALEVAAAAIGRIHDLDPEPVFRALWRRELVGSTALGCGIAIPHARIDGITAPTTLYLRAKWPIDFAAPDGKPVRHLLVIMVPTDGDTDAHLQLLAAVAQGVTERALRDRLTAANDEGAVRRAFAEALPAAGDAAARAKLVRGRLSGRA